MRFPEEISGEMFGRKNRSMKFKTRRKLQVDKHKRANNVYYEFKITLPKAWVERLLEQLGVSPDEADIELVLEYDGNVVIKSPHGS